MISKRWYLNRKQNTYTLLQTQNSIYSVACSLFQVQPLSRPQFCANCFRDQMARSSDRKKGNQRIEAHLYYSIDTKYTSFVVYHRAEQGVPYCMKSPRVTIREPTNFKKQYFVALIFVEKFFCKYNLPRHFLLAHNN